MKQTHKQKPRRVFQDVYKKHPQNEQMCVILFLGQVLSNLTRKGAYSLLNSVPRFCELLAIEKNVIVVTL